MNEERSFPAEFRQKNPERKLSGETFARCRKGRRRRRRGKWSEGRRGEIERGNRYGGRKEKRGGMRRGEGVGSE